MRTQADIVQKIEKESDEKTGRDKLGKIRGMLVPFLDFEHSKPFRDPKLLKRDWNQAELTEEAIAEQVKSYLTYAVEMTKPKNAQDDRFPLLALQHFHALAWLVGKDELAESLLSPQGNGTPQYQQVCEAFGLDWEEHKGGHKA